MNRSELEVAAAALTVPDKEACRKYAARGPVLADRVTERILALDHVEEKLIGHGNLDMMRTNHANHVEFMASTMSLYDPVLFVNALYWVASTYLAHGFRPAYWPVQISAWREAITAELSLDSSRAIMPFYNWLDRHMPIIIEHTLNR
jgi:hypothetical protein